MFITFFALMKFVFYIFASIIVNFVCNLKKNMFFFLSCEEDSVVFVEKKVIIQEHAYCLPPMYVSLIYVSLCISITGYLNYCRFINIEWASMYFLKMFSHLSFPFFKIYFALRGSLHFHINFIISFKISTKI